MYITPIFGCKCGQRLPEWHNESQTYYNKHNLRVKRVETPGTWILFFVSGPPFTLYQDFLPNIECFYRIQRPRKPPETRFCNLERSNNAIIVKIVVFEVDFRVLQTNDWTNRAMQLTCITRVLGLSSVKISVQLVRYSALHLIRTTTTRTTTRRWNKHASIWILKPLPGFQKVLKQHIELRHGVIQSKPNSLTYHRLRKRANDAFTKNYD